MIMEAPSFINSKYLVIDSKGWHLLPGAPSNLKKEFDDFMQMVNGEEGE